MSAPSLPDVARSLLKSLRCRLCRAFCGDQFFNRDASLEIDRLTAEVESLREQLAAARSAR